MIAKVYRECSLARYKKNITPRERLYMYSGIRQSTKRNTGRKQKWEGFERYWALSNLQSLGSCANTMKDAKINKHFQTFF